MTPIVASAVLLAATQGLAEEAATASLNVRVEGARSAKGTIRLALCPEGAAFPDCKDSAVRTASLKIEQGTASVRFTGLRPGVYAIAVFHDANGNDRLDTFVGIPREGYGFSQNPPFRPRAPRFSEATITIAGEETASIRLRYIL